MILDSPIISGSSTVTGNLTVLGTLTASVSGSVTSASYATNAETLDGLDSTSFTTTSSFNTTSGSFSTRVTNLESFSSSLDATFATDAQLTAVSQSFSSSLSTVSGSLSSRIANNEATGSSLTTASSSFSTRVTNTEATASSLVTASGSFSTRTTNLETASGSFSTRVTNTEATASSLTTASSSFSTRTTNLETASGSFSTRVTNAESSITLLNSRSGSFATTGSNNFNGNQVITGSLTTTGTITAQTLNVQQVTSSIVYSSGSNIFGNSVSNTQQFTGSLQVSGSNHYVLGNVGVGTTSPFGTTANRTVLSVNGTTDVSLNVGTGGTQRAYLYGSSTYADLGTIGSLPLTFSPNNTERMRITSGGNVGIGTTSPSSMLEVSKTGAQTASIFINQTDANEATIRFKSTHGSDSDYRVGASILVNSAFEIYSVAAASTRFIVTNSGSVGIGTTTPNERLQVAGAISATGTATTSFASSATMDWYSTGARFISRGANTSTAGTFTFSIESSNSSIATNAMFIANSGNVGIGTTNPTVILQVVGGVGSPVALSLSNSNSNCDIIMTSGAGGGLVRLRNNLDDFQIHTSGSQRFTIASTGAATFSGNVNVTVPNTPEVFLTHSNTSKTFLMAVDGSNAFFRANSTNNILFQVAGGTNVMALTSGGDVGIGTSSPGQKFTVAGTFVRMESLSTDNTNAGSFFRVLNGATTVGQSTQAVTNTGDYLITTGTSSESEKMRITAAGNVGIGTTTPGELLDVYKSANGAVAINVRNPSGGTAAYAGLAIGNDIGVNSGGIIVFGSGATSFSSPYNPNGTYIYSNRAGGVAINSEASAPLYLATNNTIRLYITSGGNVGIGTTSPSRNFSLVGTSRHERIYGYGNNVLSIPNSVSFGTVWIHLGTCGAFTTDKIYYRIGTNTSEEEGEITVSNTCSLPFIQWQRNTYNAMVVQVRARMQYGCGPCEVWMQVRYGSDYGGANTTFQWQTYNGTDSGFSVVNAVGTPGTGTNEKSITGSEGYFYANSGTITVADSIGIGTTSPSQKLEVVGGEIKAGRVDSSSEGGQISFGRASDNATGWYIDAYGSTSSPSLRFVDVSNSAVRMIIDGSGNVTKPSQPAFRAGRSTSYSPGGASTIVFNSTSGFGFNIGGHYNTSNGRFTAPVNGVYNLTVCVIWESVPDGQQMDDAFEIRVNGSTAAYSFNRAEYVAGTTGNGGYYVDNATVLLNLTAGQYVEVYNRFNLTIHGNQNYCYFSGYLVG
jgi:hypothetical protein